MVAYIDAHRDAHGIEPICALRPIAPSTYWRHKAQQADPTRRSARAQRDDELKREITRVWHEQEQVYGAETASAAWSSRPSRGRFFNTLKNDGVTTPISTDSGGLEELVRIMTRGPAYALAGVGRLWPRVIPDSNQ